MLRGGDVLDVRLQRYCTRLDARFRTYLNYAPVPQWAPGLLLQGDMRSLHELYLPMEEIIPAFVHLCRLSCLYHVDPLTIPLFAAGSWPDFLARLQLYPLLFNPAMLLRRLATDEQYRRVFLFCMFVPRSYGGSFGRYPRQRDYLAKWLSANKERLSAAARVLDAACGCGEGTYEVAETLLAHGYGAGTRVDGSTLEPLELLAAAFGSYPNDPARAVAFKARVGSIINSGGDGMIRFFREDICNPADSGEMYDVILCNGLLGGPLLHGKERQARAVRSLLARLKTGGLLLFADRFHQGWKRKQQGELLSLLRENMLEISDAGEGIAGIKNGTAAHPRRAHRQSP